MMRVHLWNATLGEMIELNSRGWTCLSLPGMGGSVALPGTSNWPQHITIWWHEPGHSVSLPGLLETIPSVCAFRSALLLTAAAAFLESLGDALKAETQRHVSFSSRQTTINPLNSPWKPTPGLQVCKAGSSPVSWAPPWAESLIKRSWSSSLRSMAKRPSILGRTKVLGLANNFR